jgi:hypothetical protein
MSSKSSHDAESTSLPDVPARAPTRDAPDAPDEREVAILEVQERYDEPAAEPLESDAELELLAEVMRELARRRLHHG